MSQTGLLELNVRELALVYEQMHRVMQDDSFHISERNSAEKIFNRCGNMMGRDEDAPFPNEDDRSDLGWNRY